MCERLLPHTMWSGILAHFQLYLSHLGTMTHAPHCHPTSIPLPILLLYLETGSHQVAHIGLVCGKLAAVASDVNLSTFF